MCNHLMLDLETLSTQPDAAIVSIGAVVFDKDRVYSCDKMFSWYCDLEDSAKYGHVDMRTLLWWLGQSDEARKSTFFGKERGPLEDGLKMLAHFVKVHEVGYLWGNGAAFDNVVLRNAYRKLGLYFPVSYRGDMCYRTAKTMSPDTGFERLGVYHSAVDDAHSQAVHLLKINKVTGCVDDML